MGQSCQTGGWSDAVCEVISFETNRAEAIVYRVHIFINGSIDTGGMMCEPLNAERHEKLKTAIVSHSKRLVSLTSRPGIKHLPKQLLRGTKLADSSSVLHA